MPNPATGYGIGVGHEGSGAPSQGNRSANAIKALVPANTRPISLHPGAVVVGTAHNSGTQILGAIPQAGAGLLSPGEPVREIGNPATWTAGDQAGFQGNGWLVTNTGGGGGGGGSTLAQFVLSSADILALLTTPFVLVVEPGAGKIIEIDWAFYFTTPGLAAYTIDGGIGIVWDSAAAIPVPALTSADFVGALTQADQVTGFAHGDTGANVIGDPSLVINQNLCLANLGSTTIADGDGTLTIVLAYQTVTLPT